MPFSSQKFRDFEELQVYLNGGVICGVDVSQGIYGLVGNTLTFTRPAFSVTFTPVAGRIDGILYAPEIRSQIVAADPNVDVLVRGNKLIFIEKTPTFGVALDPAASQVTKTALGLPVTGSCEGRIVKQMGSPAPPRLEHIQQTRDGSYHLLIWEGN